MKKLLMFTAAAFVMTAPVAMAEDAAHPHMSRMFEKSDTDHDGVVTKAEFMKVHEDRFTKMDADGDGKITKEEAQKSAEEWKAKMKEERAQRMQSTPDIQEKTPPKASDE